MAARAEHVGKLKTGRELVRFTMQLDSEACTKEGEDHWIHVLPHGPEVHARDGRSFTVKDLEAVVRNTELPMLVDVDHRSEFGETLASGWIEQLKVEPASAGDRAGIWGRVDWTRTGLERVQHKDFRFISPVVLGTRAKDGRRDLSVEKLASVALTNRPALKMQGIDAFREQLSARYGAFAPDNEEPMDLAKLVRSACGLSDDATEDQISQALTERLKPKGEAGGDATSLRAALSTMTTERNALTEKVTKLEGELSGFRTESFKREVQVFFDDGARAGKILPANREEWVKYALASESNFKTFREVIYPGLPVMGTPQGPSAGAKPPKGKREKLSGTSTRGVDYDALKAIGLTDKQIREAEAEVFKVKSDGPDDDDEDEDDDEDGADEGDTTDHEGAPGGA